LKGLAEWTFELIKCTDNEGRGMMTDEMKMEKWFRLTYVHTTGATSYYRKAEGTLSNTPVDWISKNRGLLEFNQASGTKQGLK